MILMGRNWWWFHPGRGTGQIRSHATRRASRSPNSSGVPAREPSHGVGGARARRWFPLTAAVRKNVVNRPSCLLLARASLAFGLERLDDGGNYRRLVRRIAHAQLGIRQVSDEVLELVQFGEPFIGLIEMFDGRIDASGEGLGVFGGNGIRANQFDLLVKPVLLGDHERQIFVGLFDSLLPFAKDLQSLHA